MEKAWQQHLYNYQIHVRKAKRIIVKEELKKNRRQDYEKGFILKQIIIHIRKHCNEKSIWILGYSNR